MPSSKRVYAIVSWIQGLKMTPFLKKTLYCKFKVALSYLCTTTWVKYIKENEEKLVLNITYHPCLAQLKNIMNRIHLCAAPFVEHLPNKKIYYKVTKEKGQMIFSHMVDFCSTGG